MANSLTIERDKKEQNRDKTNDGHTDTLKQTDTRKHADVKTNRKERTKQYINHAL